MFRAPFVLQTGHFGATPNALSRTNLPLQTGRMALLRHHERNSPLGLPVLHYRSNHITLEANTSESSSTKLFPALHLCYKLPYYKLATSESSSEKHPKRSTQRVAPDRAKTHSRLHFAPSTRAISAKGCAGPGQNALSPALCALRHARSSAK